MGRRRGTSLQQCERVEHECNRLGIRPPIVDEVYNIPLAPKPRVLSHFTIPEAASIAQSIGLVACLCLLVHRELRRESALCVGRRTGTRTDSPSRTVDLSRLQSSTTALMVPYGIRGIHGNAGYTEARAIPQMHRIARSCCGPLSSPSRIVTL